ncbi:MAG: peptidylprolyl isomerase [Pseudomonadota bacterium]
MTIFQTKRLLATATAFLTITCGAAFAQEAPAEVSPDTVVGTVGDEQITERDLQYTLQDLEGQFAQMPPGQQRFAALMSLIDIRLLAQKADEEGVDETDAFQERMQFLRTRALHNLYFQSEVIDQITEDEVRARYDEEVAATPPTNETRARHILVESEDEAKAIIEEINGGADFVEVAQEKSTGPSAPQGGDLGYFGPGRMVPEFDTAVNALNPGEITAEPVQTQFGWHVIRVEDRRPVQPPAFAQVEPQIRNALLRERYLNLLQSLRADAPVDVTDPALKEAFDAAMARQQQTPEATPE